MAGSTVWLAFKKVLTSGVTHYLPTTPYTNATPPDNTTVQSFAAGVFAPVAVPAGATGVVIQPGTNTGTAGIFLKGVTGDTGVALHPNQPTFLSLYPAGASFGIVCANALVIEFEWT